VSHSGDITVESEPGQGTTFHVYLPEIQPHRQAVPGHDQEPLDTP